MSNTWFRLYHEFGSDPKVQMMNEVDQRRLIMLMCLRCCNNVKRFRNVSDETVAFYMRVSLEQWRVSKDRFIKAGFIDNRNNLLNWDKRQFISDTSTSRVRKHRQKKQNETFQKRFNETKRNGPEQNRTYNKGGAPLSAKKSDKDARKRQQQTAQLIKDAAGGEREPMPQALRAMGRKGKQKA